MVMYLKNQAGYKQSYFKGMKYEEIRPIFEKVWDQTHTFVPMDSEDKEKDSEKKGSRKKSLARKRAGEKQSEEKDFAMEIESLATKYPIVDWKTHVLTENFMYYQIFRADGSFKNYKIFSEMLDDFDRHDVLDLHRLVKARYMTSSLEGYELMLWGDLKILFEPDKEDEVWRNQHEYNLISWRLFDSCEIHILLMNNGIAIHMMIEKKGIHVEETKVNAVRDKSSPKTLPEVRNNKVVDALSRNTTLLVSISNEVVGFESIKELYASDEDFHNTWMELKTKQHRGEFLLLGGYLFKGNRLCIPTTSLTSQLIKEIHAGGLSAHLGRDKTIASVESRFYWPQLKWDVEAFVKRCIVCQEGKTKAQNTGFSKMAHFIPCKKTSDAAHIESTAHPQTDGQTELVNRALANMIRCLWWGNPKLWDVSLAQAKFAYNSAVQSSTRCLPFEVVYKTSPRHVVDLFDLPGKKNVQANRMVEEVQATHEVVRANITEANAKYKIAMDKHRRKKLFQVGDEVMVFLRKERFPVGTYSKLQPKKYGPYKVLRKINDNAFVVDLPNTMSISKTFNVSDIYEFHSEDVNEGKHSRTSSSKGRENDEDMIQELAKEYMDQLKHVKSKGAAKNK
ncbi:RNA-directed DNA polymerase [Tanacetum coccineum]